MQKFRIRAHGVIDWILCSISCRNPTKKDTLNWRIANILNALSHHPYIPYIERDSIWYYKYLLHLVQAEEQ